MSNFNTLYFEYDFEEEETQVLLFSMSRFILPSTSPIPTLISYAFLTRSMNDNYPTIIKKLSVFPLLEIDSNY